METDGWAFRFGDFNGVGDYIRLSNDHRDIDYSFRPSLLPKLVQAVADLAAEFDLPAANLEPMELVRLALKIDPEEVICNPSDVQETVNRLSAIFVKMNLFSTEVEAYLHEGGVLSHSVYTTGESWTYVFEDDSGRWSEIRIRHEKPGDYPNIGFEIDDKVVAESVYSLPWLPLFFEAASEPTKDRLVRLRDLVLDHPLSEDVDEMLDAKIAEFH